MAVMLIVPPVQLRGKKALCRVKGIMERSDRISSKLKVILWAVVCSVRNKNRVNIA